MHIIGIILNSVQKVPDAKQYIRSDVRTNENENRVFCKCWLGNELESYWIKGLSHLTKSTEMQQFVMGYVSFPSTYRPQHFMLTLVFLHVVEILNF